MLLLHSCMTWGNELGVPAAHSSISLLCSPGAWLFTINSAGITHFIALINTIMPSKWQVARSMLWQTGTFAQQIRTYRGWNRVGGGLGWLEWGEDGVGGGQIGPGAAMPWRGCGACQIWIPFPGLIHIMGQHGPASVGQRRLVQVCIYPQWLPCFRLGKRTNNPLPRGGLSTTLHWYHCIYHMVNVSIKIHIFLSNTSMFMSSLALVT